MTRLATFALAAAITVGGVAAQAQTTECFNGHTGERVPCNLALAPDRSWHLLTQSYGGTVSLIRDLTKHECEFARARALHLPATDAEKEEER